MPWQRNLDDALALVERTGKPLLVCVNMDGESASESLARSRYHDPRFIELVEGFVPVLASPTRHFEADYGNRGWRLPDPKFGRIVESEHITHEPTLYKRYFSGNRVAPRHVGVAADGAILFDLFLLNDLGVIDRTLKQYGKFDVPPLNVDVMTRAELLDCPDAAARERFEREFVAEADAVREQIAAVAFSNDRATQHPAIIRMALRDPAPGVRHAAVRGVAGRIVYDAEHDGTAFAVPFLPDAFRVAAEFDGLREELARATAALAKSSDEEEAKRGMRLAPIFEGLVATSEVVDVDRWLAAFAVAQPEEEVELSMDDLSERLSMLDSEVALDPTNATVNLTFAKNALELAQRMLADGGGNPSWVLEDGAASCGRVLIAGPNALASAFLARIRFLLNEMDAAADAARDALPELVASAASALAHDTLDAFVQARTRAIYKLLSDEAEVPVEWVTDTVAAYRVLAAHPLATEADVVACLDFLRVLEALGEQTEIVRDAIVRLPGAGQLHFWMRYCVLRDQGIEALATLYDDLKAPKEFEAAFDWHAGVANLIAGDTLGRDGRGDESVESYDASIARFQKSMASNPEYGPSAGHYLVLAHAGLARRLADAGDLDGAMHELRLASKLVPSSFAETDGTGRRPRDTVNDILDKLRRAGRSADAQALKAELEAAKVRF